MKQVSLIIMVTFLSLAGCNNKSIKVASPSFDSATDTSYQHALDTAGRLITPPPVEGMAPPIADSSMNAETDPLKSPLEGMGLNPLHGVPGHRCDVPVGVLITSPEIGKSLCK